MTGLEALRWQYGLIWRLAAVHLPSLTDSACLWEPVPGSWTVRPSSDGHWRPDWSDREPEPAPPVTIGWLTWHLIWWWSGLVTAVRGEASPRREAVFWPGTAETAVRHIEALAEDWATMLDGLDEADLANPLSFPWPEPRPLSCAIAWANAELMKNIAEIGCIRHQYEARSGNRAA